MLRATAGYLTNCAEELKTKVWSSYRRRINTSNNGKTIITTLQRKKKKKKNRRNCFQAENSSTLASWNPNKQEEICILNSNILSTAALWKSLVTPFLAISLQLQPTHCI